MSADEDVSTAAAGVQPPPALQSSDEAQQAFNSAPPYFRFFLDLFQRTDARNAAILHDNTCAVRGFADRVDTIERNHQLQNAERISEIRAIRNNVAILAVANEAQAHRNALDDPREIVVRGIPVSMALTPFILPMHFCRL